MIRFVLRRVCVSHAVVVYSSSPVESACPYIWGLSPAIVTILSSVAKENRVCVFSICTRLFCGCQRGRLIRGNAASFFGSGREMSPQMGCRQNTQSVFQEAIDKLNNPSLLHSPAFRAQLLGTGIAVLPRQEPSRAALLALNGPRPTTHDPTAQRGHVHNSPSQAESFFHLPRSAFLTRSHMRTMDVIGSLSVSVLGPAKRTMSGIYQVQTTSTNIWSSNKPLR